MSPVGQLFLYCLLILLASLLGGWVPLLARLTHRRMELLVSFVSGVMLGVAVLHLLPHAWMQRAEWLERSGAQPVVGHELISPVVGWLLVGFLAMFFVERFFCFHHHDVPGAAGEPCRPPAGHGHKLTWTGAAIGLTLHSLAAGVALAASVEAEPVSSAGGAIVWTTGFSTFLAVFLHKPFDSMTIGTLMAVGRRSTRARHLVNVAFGLVVPVGVGLFFLGAGAARDQASGLVSCALAFSAGTFLCISLSDLLPELQFHQHDRLKLSAALLLGLVVAWASARVEAGHHEAEPAPVEAGAGAGVGLNP
ncbi:MAG: ZIP family metal transporter [Planctomycetota bacterium]|jgi:zinc and cadmium transporter